MSETTITEELNEIVDEKDATNTQQYCANSADCSQSGNIQACINTGNCTDAVNSGYCSNTQTC